VNISAFFCPRCKNRVTWNAVRKEWVPKTIYESCNPEDWLYGKMLCNADRCMVCDATLAGRPCRYEMCYGTGRGDCASCERYEAVRYACCQMRQRENEAQAEEIQKDMARRSGDGR
jgi:hypothetical protein